jgi:hypothetical protein
VIQRCATHGKRVCIRCKWAAVQTALFPLEHTVWERAPGFSWVAHLLGL